DNAPKTTHNFSETKLLAQIEMLQQKNQTVKIQNQILKKRLKQLETARRLQNERLALAIETSKTGLWDWNLDTGEFYLDRNIKAFLGYKNDEIPNDLNRWGCFVHEEEQIPAYENALVFLTGQREDYFDVHRMRHKDGSYRWIQFRGRVICNKNRHPTRIIGIGLDVTDQKNGNEKLRQSEEKFRLLFENAPVAYQSLDENGMIVAVNQTWLDKLGYSSKGEVQNRLFSEFIAPGFRTKFKENFKKFKKQGTIRCNELVVKKKNGELIYVLFDGRVNFDEQGKFLQSYCIMQDISERKRAEEELRISEERYRILVETIEEGIGKVDENENFQFVNQATTTIFGYPKEELLGKNISQFLMPDEFQKVLKQTQIRMTGQSGHYELQITRKDGERRVISIHASAIIGHDGKYRGSFAAFHDITEQKRTESRLAKHTEALVKRVKELECLYGITNLVEQEKNPLERILYRIATLIPTGWQYPEFTCARIMFLGQIFSSRHFQETPWRQQAEITVSGKKVGFVEVFYSQEMPEMDEGPFFEEERNLINIIAKHLGNMIKEKWITDALRSNEEKFRSIFENSPIGIILFDSSGSIYDSNPASVELVGFIENTNKLKYNLFNDPNLLPIFAEKLRKGETVRIEARYDFEKIKDLGLYDTHKSGIHYFDALITPYKINPSDFKNGYLLQFQDITEQKLAHESLQEAEIRYRQLYNEAPVGYHELDKYGKIIQVNQTEADFLGYTIEAMQGRSIFEFIVPEEQEKARELFFQKFSTNMPLKGFERRYLDRDGRERSYYIEDRRIFDLQGQVIGIRSTMQDIEELKIAENKIKASLEEKEVLLREIHHRVKNNMQIISSLFNLQTSKIDDPRLITILKESQNRILSLSLIHEKLYHSDNFSKINFSDYVNNLIHHLFASYRLDARKIKTKVNIEPVFFSIDTMIPCGLILNELITNALKYAFPNNRQGEIEIKLFSSQLNEFILIVRDNGIGFIDLEFSNNKGLGMELIKGLTRQINGKIFCETRRQQGTEFRIIFQNPDSIRQEL
ncbi:PAS domain S-box protein, partial [candidate division KSB1 bacterium]|nr:PAS domain S-box protein [candidate division KSB1 bacterium]